MKKFPHDRCLQRMVEEEFKANQPFLYPEEYDVFNQDEEKGLKKNFPYEKKAQGDKTLSWKTPNFENEQTVLENFVKRDIDDKNDLERYMKKEKQKEVKLENYVQQQAIEYHEYMQKRS